MSLRMYKSANDTFGLKPPQVWLASMVYFRLRREGTPKSCGLNTTTVLSGVIAGWRSLGGEGVEPWTSLKPDVS